MMRIYDELRTWTCEGILLIKVVQAAVICGGDVSYLVKGSQSPLKTFTPIIQGIYSFKLYFVVQKLQCNKTNGT